MSQPTPRILLVDDDPEISTFIATLLELEGFAPQLAATATEARQAFAAGGFSLVLLDVAMPEVDGLTLCRELRAAGGPRVPVFVVSARPGDDVVEEALASGADRFVRKPFENAALIDAIRNALA